MSDFDYFHLRKPAYHQDELLNVLELLPREILDKTVLHSHFDLASEFELLGIATAENRTAESQQKVVSYSAHSIDEIRSLDENPIYVFLSPIYDSISKEGYESKFDLYELEKSLLSIDKKVIALGGIDEQKIRRCEEIGFAGVAMLGSVWEPLLNPAEWV